MRFVIGLGLTCATLFLAGCAHHKPAPHPAPPATKPQAPPAPSQKPKTVIKPDFRAAGHVAMVNQEARFVVLNFPPGPVPRTGQRLGIYHNGLKVGVVTVTGPQHENDTVADITDGEAQLKDEVREE